MASSSNDSIPLATLLHMVTIKLTSTNFLLWQNQITTALRCDSLLSIVDGTELCPSATATSSDGQRTSNPDFVSWGRRHDRALCLILSSLTEESMTEVLGYTSARDVWLALESAFCPKSQSRAHQLRDELQFLKRGSSDVSNFARKFHSLSHQLAAIGEPVADSDKIRWFLRGLGPEFQTFTDIHLAMPSPVPFRDLVARARDHELRHKSISSTDVAAPQAVFFAGKGRTNNSGGHGRNNGGSGGSRGQRRDGQRRDGSSNDTGQNSSRSSAGQSRSSGNSQQSGGQGYSRRPFIPKCQICQDEHFAPDCPLRYSKLPSPAANLAQAFDAQCSLTPSSQSDWFVDTGASAHMTSSPAVLDDFETYNESGNSGGPSKRTL